jgi:hypothetical protein
MGGRLTGGALCGEKNTVYIYLKQFDASTGQETTPSGYRLWGSTIGFLNGIALPPYGWKHEFQRQRSVRHHSTGRSVVMGTVLVLDGSTVYALNNDGAKLSRSTLTREREWTVPIPQGSRPKGIILAGGKLVMSLIPDVSNPRSGEVRVYDAVDGAELGRCAFPRAREFDGMAAAPGHVLVSAQDGSIVCLGQ